MKTSMSSLFALTLGAVLATTQDPATAQNVQINPAAQQAAIAPAQPAAMAATTETTETATTVATATQMHLLPARTVLKPWLRQFDDFGMPGFGGRSRCGHVINMLMARHMHDEMFDDEEPVVSQARPVVAFDPFGRPIVMHRLGDLKLVDVQMVSDATDAIGPLYEISLLNDSRRCARDFRVTLVAVCGSIMPNSPTVTMHVDEIGPGETLSLQVQLPHACLAIAMNGAVAAPFDLLVVAIDSFDELMEESELNNVAVLQRSDIVLEGVTTETTVTTEGAEVAAPADTAPAEVAPEGNVPVEGEADAPEENATPAPQDQLDLDNLGLDDEMDSAETSFFK